MKRRTGLKLGLVGLLAACLMSQSWADAASTEQPTAQHKMDQLAADLASYPVQDSIGRYHSYKAKMWLTYAQNELSETSLTTSGQEALQHAQILAEALATGKVLSLTTPILSSSQVMRRDLWQHIEYLKQQGALEQAPELLAHAEVMLVWAAAEYCELGWRHANQQFNAVEQMLYQAIEISGINPIDHALDWDQLPTLTQLNATGCNGVNMAFWPMDKSAKKSAVKVHNVVHFALDSEQLSPMSQVVLDQFISTIKQSPSIEMTVLGYTDRRSGQAYHLKLAQRRIQTVQSYLIQSGIGANRIQSEAKGAKDLKSDPHLAVAHAKSRRVVLQLNDADQIQIEPQWQDLQLEVATHKSEGEAK